MPQEESLSVRFLGDNTPLEKASQEAVGSFDKVTVAADKSSKALERTTLVSEKASKAAQIMATNAAKMGGSLEANTGKVDKVAQALSKIANIDPSGSFAAATNRINASIDKMVDEALGIGPAFEKPTGIAIKSIFELEQEIKRLGDQLVRSVDTKEITRLGNEIKNLEREAKHLKFFALEGTFKNLSKNSQLAGNSLQRLKPQSDSATGALINLSRVVQDAPFGFLGIANNLNPLLESFQRLRKESGSNATALKALGASLIGGGGIGLALGVVSSLLIVFGDKLFGMGKKAEQAKQPLKELKESIETVAAGFSAESVTKIEIFRAALTNLALPLEERNKVLDKYNQLVDKQNELSKTDLNNIGKINAAINAQIDLFQKRALVRGAEDKIKDLFKQVFEAQFELTKNVSGVTSGQNQIAESFDKSLPAFGKMAAATDKLNKAKADSNKTTFRPLTAKEFETLKDANTGISFLEQGLASLSNKDFIIDVETGAITKKSDVLIKKITDTRNQIKELFGFINKQISEGGVNVLDNFDVELKKPKAGEFNFFDKFFGFDFNGKLSEKQTSSLMEAANSFSKEFGDVLEGLDFHKSTKEGAFEAAKTFWINYRKGIFTFKPVKGLEDITVQPPTINLSDGRNQVEDFLKGIQQGFDKVNPNNVGVLPDALARQRITTLEKFRQLYREIGLALPTVIKQELENGLSKPVNINDIPTPNLDAALAANLQKILAFGNAIKAAFGTNFQSLFSDIGTGLADALQKGFSPLEAITNSIAKFVGATISQIGDALIAYGVQKAILDKILIGGIAIPGGFAIAAGIAAKAIGQLIASSQPKKFEQGGLVFGRTLAEIGEGRGTTRHNPEIVSPLNKLEQYLGKGGGGDRLISRVSGTDLELILVRNGKRNGRVR